MRETRQVVKGNPGTMSFNGKVVLITGASSGIGENLALKLGKLEATLVLVGRNVDRLKETIVHCPGGEDRHLLLAVDLNNEQAVAQIMPQIVAKYQRLDVLVNNAGILEGGSIEETSLEQYDRIMNTNMRAVYQLTMLAVPELKRTKGNIVNVSSVCGLRAFPGVLAYNVSKAALDQFTRCVALELAASGVRCNAVNPGVIVTDLHRRGGMDEQKYQQFLEHCKTTHALGRAGRVEEVSEAICFLADESKSSFTTGVTLSVDGGRQVMCPR